MKQGELDKAGKVQIVTTGLDTFIVKIIDRDKLDM